MRGRSNAGSRRSRPRNMPAAERPTLAQGASPGLRTVTSFRSDSRIGSIRAAAAPRSAWRWRRGRPAQGLSEAAYAATEIMSSTDSSSTTGAMSALQAPARAPVLKS
jgi:hypothetical protein